MKRIVVCDSGLGGLNIAARFFAENLREVAPECEIVYFNAYPEAGRGFNTFPSERRQEEVLRDVFVGIGHFEPDLCLIACNTLSIVWERLSARYTPPFPVAGIVEAATQGMAAALMKDERSTLLVLGTRSTVESGTYPKRLVALGIDGSRLYALGCPKLATLDRKSTRLNSSHATPSRMPSSA